MSSEAPMLENYRNTVEIETKPMIYSRYMNDGKRNIISRWRLSNHKLNIELGRYSTPKIPREDRKCLRCDVVEDEFHAIFVCPTFHLLRVKYDRIILKYSSVKTFFKSWIFGIVWRGKLFRRNWRNIRKKVNLPGYTRFNVGIFIAEIPH